MDESVLVQRTVDTLVMRALNETLHNITLLARFHKESSAYPVLARQVVEKQLELATEYAKVEIEYLRAPAPLIKSPNHIELERAAQALLDALDNDVVMDEHIKRLRGALHPIYVPG